MQTASHHNRNKYCGLAFKLSVWILAGAAAVFLTVFFYYFFNTRRMALRDIEENIRHLTLATVSRVETVFQSTERIPGYMAALLEQPDLRLAALPGLISNAVAANPVVYGCAVAFEPHAADTARLYYAPYVCRSPAGLEMLWLGGTNYHYFDWDWYQIPRELGQPIWSEPYYDESGGQMLMTTYAAPFYLRPAGQRRLGGVVTADITLERLVEMVGQVSVFSSGYAFLISRNGVFLAHPDQSLVMRESIFSLADEAGDPELRRVGRAMLRGGSGMARISYPRLARRRARMYYAPLASLGGSLGVVVPENELYAGVYALGRRAVLFAAAGLAGLALMVACIARAIARPVTALAQSAAEVAAGRLNAAVPEVRSRDEVGVLARAFRGMTASLAALVRQVQAAAARLVETAAGMTDNLRRQENTVAEFGASTSEIAAAVKEISVTGQELAHTMQELQDAAAAAAALADSGRSGLGAMDGSMRRLEAAAGSLAARLAAINAKTASINNMVAIINQVAEQTNLLSLNAAIEAEKAGEYGRGFAVVAREIRRLADQTDVAGTDIRRTVREMQASVSTGVMEVDKFNNEVGAGLHTVNGVVAQLGRIIEQVQTLSSRFVLVNEGMHAQSAGARQISEAMASLNEAARKTVESLGRFSASAGQLKDAAGQLQSQTEQFRV